MSVDGEESSEIHSRRFGKSDGRKIVLVGPLPTGTSVSNEWISNRLGIEHPGSVSLMLSAGRADRDLARKRNALTQIPLPDENPPYESP